MKWDFKDCSPTFSDDQKKVLLEAFSILGGMMNYVYHRDETERLAAKMYDWIPQLKELPEWPKCLTMAKPAPKHESLEEAWARALPKN